MNLNGRIVKARYQTTNLGMVPVTYTKCSYVTDKETKERSLKQEQVTEQREAWLVRLPSGDSTRFVGERGKAELKRLGFDRKPRLIDMETGDVVDIGGDPYDLDTGSASTQELTLSDE